jgi:hypothetical protein
MPPGVRDATTTLERRKENMIKAVLDTADTIAILVPPYTAL